jgi:hypothetical protein
LNHALFVSEDVILSRWGVQGGQECHCKDSNVAAIMLTTPCRVSGATELAIFCFRSVSSSHEIKPHWRSEYHDQVGFIC